jgi:branched-chain amino acid transport system substrate-binding protein
MKPRTTTKWSLTAGLAVLGLVALSACAADAGSGSGAGGDAGNGKGGDVSVGVLVDRTAYLKGLDLKVLDGIQASIDATNKAGGVLGGKKIVLDIQDTSADPQKQVQGFQRTLSQKSPVAFLNGFSSAGNAAAAPAAEAAKVPMVVASVVPADDQKWVFSSIVPVKYETETRAAYLKSKGITKIAVLADPTPYSKSSQTALEADLKTYGLTKVAQEENATDAVDLRPQINKLLAAKPDAIIKIGTGASQVVAARAMAQANSKIPLLVGVETDANLKQATDAYPNTLFVASPPTVYDQLAADQKSKALEALKASFGDESDLTYIARGYDAANVLVQAINKAGKADGSAIRDALEGMDSYDGGTAVYKYTADNHYGIDKNPTYLAQIVDGKNTILFPAE